MDSRKLVSSFSVCLFIFLQSAFAQLCDNSNYIDCNGTVICDVYELDNVSSCTQAATFDTQGSFCGGQLHNPVFFNFVAGSTSVEFLISELECDGSEFPGIQAGIVSYCNPADCYSDDATTCHSFGAFQVLGTGLVPGNIYSLLIDGCPDSECSFLIEVLDGEPFDGQLTSQINASLEDFPSCDISSSIICPNSTIIFESENFAESEMTFCWSVDNLNGVQSNTPNQACQANDFSSGANCTGDFNNCGTLELSFSEPGEYTVCLDQFGNACGTADVFDCIIIHIGFPDNQNFGTVSICELDIPAGVTVDGPDGEAWLGPDVLEGFNSFPVTNECGCIFNQEITVNPILVTEYYADVDADGFGSADNTIEACSVPFGYVENNEDCFDFDENWNPAAVDIPDNGVDEDCDGEDFTLNFDDDGDGFRLDVDCDDTNANIFPGAPELCDGIDNNCNGAIDEEYETVFYQAFRDFTNTDGPVPDNFFIDIPDCDSIRISMEVSTNGAEWLGLQNLEANEECIGANGPCPGNPYMGLEGDCNLCWDFLFASLVSGSTLLYSEVLGDSVHDATDTTWVSPWFATNDLGPSLLEIQIIGQTWAADETLSYTNLTMVCYDECPQCSSCSSSINPVMAPVTDAGVVAVDACNENSSSTSCAENVSWIKLLTDSLSAVLDLEIFADFNPVVCIYPESCEADPIYSNASNAHQLQVNPNSTYYIGIGVQEGKGGSFKIELETRTNQLACTTNQSIDVNRFEYPTLSNNGPYLPNETVEFCTSFDFTADDFGQGNNCQFLHGIVPVLGGAWDVPSSELSVQGPDGSIWFEEDMVDYNMDNSSFGLIENCDGSVGLALGGQLETGDLLPAGWWFLGENCEDPMNENDPNSTWGLAIECGETLQLNFCFNLKIRDITSLEIPDCELDAGVDIYTFSDGETGCSSASVCGDDLPIIFDATVDLSGIPCPDPGTCNTDCQMGDLEVWDEMSCECIVQTEVIFGCIDSTALNYNVLANCDDGNCDYPCPDPGNCNKDCLLGDLEIWDADSCTCILELIVVTGCIDSTALNYNALSNCDDGSCEYPCLDPGTCNDDCLLGDLEIWDADSCACILELTVITGCIDSTALNYNALSNCDDGSCEYLCPDPGTCNEDCLLGDLEIWDAEVCACISELEIIEGCIDSTALNYNALSNCDDGSCEYLCPDPGTCNEDCLLGDLEIWDAEVCACISELEIIEGCIDSTALNYNSLANCDDGSCEFDCLDPGTCNTDCFEGDLEIWDGNTCQCVVDLVIILGCTNVNSCNFNSVANCEDGSCISNDDPGICNTDCSLGDLQVWDGSSCECVVSSVSILGCTNSNASNFDPAANCDDGSCIEDCPTYYHDADSDGFGNPESDSISCEPLTFYVLNNEDCDDANENINPNADEIPGNGIDEDCDGMDLIPVDIDNDGFDTSVDCDDSNPEVNPGAEEICDGVDNNCNGELDEGLLIAVYSDMDGDGYGDPNTVGFECQLPPDLVLSGGDCDDANPQIFPGAEEIANNNIDEDCDGQILIIDQDGDGFNSSEDCDDQNPQINPSATEIPDNDIDEDCDGIIEITDAIEEIGNIKYEIFPNPFSQSFSIQLEDFSSLVITLYDINGTKLDNYLLETTLFQIDATELTSGVYVLVLETKDGKYRKTERLVKL